MVLLYCEKFIGNPDIAWGFTSKKLALSHENNSCNTLYNKITCYRIYSYKNHIGKHLHIVFVVSRFIFFMLNGLDGLTLQ